MTDEAHLSAEQSCSRASSRLPRAHGDGGRPQGAGSPPGPRPEEAVGLTLPVATLSRRADFLAANRGRRQPTTGFVLLVHPRGDGDAAMRVGFTVTKKIGGAVIRNRMKRRFRALARELLLLHGLAGADHVIIGRQGGVERPFDDLRRELARALAKLAR